MLNAKVEVVLPNPCKMLDRVPDKYKNGQRKERARICVATYIFLNKSSPSIFEEMKKNAAKANPRIAHEKMV